MASSLSSVTSWCPSRVCHLCPISFPPYTSALDFISFHQLQDHRPSFTSSVFAECSITCISLSSIYIHAHPQNIFSKTIPTFPLFHLISVLDFTMSLGRRVQNLHFSMLFLSFLQSSLCQKVPTSPNLFTECHHIGPHILSWSLFLSVFLRYCNLLVLLLLVSQIC